MKHKLLILLLVVAPSLFAQKKTEEIPSEKLKTTREITVTIPPSYNSDKNKKYPLLVLLDGEYLVDPFAGTLSYTTYWDDLPEVIIVGINQNQKGVREMDSQSGEQSGLPEEQGEKFFEFIGMEVLPYIEKKYRVAPYKIIAGHNLTAGFLNFFLYKDEPLFNAYIALSPEMATDMETRIPARLTAIEKPITYYLASADGDVARLKKKIKILDENIKAVKNPALKYHFDEFKDASHYSLVAYGIPNALYYIFSAYQPITSLEYQTKLVTLPSGYVKYLDDKYTVLEKELGVKMAIRLTDFKAAEAAILKNGVYEELQELADLARKNYPKTLIGEYYTALYYEKTGDIKRAIKTYINSYAFNEIGDITKDFMLERAEILKSSTE
jgi:predicted alpha/beta superfamily hydrolase